VADDERHVFVACEQPLERGGVAERRLVQALAAGEAERRVGVRRLGAVLVDGAALQLADADVAEVVLDDAGDVATFEREVRRLDDARKRRDGGELDRDRLDLSSESLRLVDPLLGEAPVEQRVAVDDPGDVEERLAVSGEQEDPHRRSLCAALVTSA